MRQLAILLIAILALGVTTATVETCVAHCMENHQSYVPLVTRYWKKACQKDCEEAIAHQEAKEKFYAEHKHTLGGLQKVNFRKIKTNALNKSANSKTFAKKALIKAKLGNPVVSSGFILWIAGAYTLHTYVSIKNKVVSFFSKLTGSPAAVAQKIEEKVADLRFKMWTAKAAFHNVQEEIKRLIAEKTGKAKLGGIISGITSEVQYQIMMLRFKWWMNKPAFMQMKESIEKFIWGKEHSGKQVLGSASSDLAEVSEEEIAEAKAAGPVATDEKIEMLKVYSNLAKATYYRIKDELDLSEEALELTEEEKADLSVETADFKKLFRPQDWPIFRTIQAILEFAQWIQHK